MHGDTLSCIAIRKKTRRKARAGDVGGDEFALVDSLTKANSAEKVTNSNVSTAD